MISASYSKQGLDFSEIVEDADLSITEVAQEMLRLPIGKSFENMKIISGGDSE